jgi:hypothetical protein
MKIGIQYNKQNSTNPLILCLSATENYYSKHIHFLKKVSNQLAPLAHPPSPPSAPMPAAI